MTRRTSLISRSVGLALSGVAVFALSTEAWSQIDEIVVTTRKREEDLQQVPVAVQAITAQDIERKGLNTLQAWSGNRPASSSTRGSSRRTRASWSAACRRPAAARTWRC